MDDLDERYAWQCVSQLAHALGTEKPVVVDRDQGRGRGRQVVDQGPDVELLRHGLHSPRLDLGQVEHVVDQGEQVRSRSVDLLEVGDDLRVALVLRVSHQHLAVTQDRILGGA
jgi:hypothetical protein